MDDYKILYSVGEPKFGPNLSFKAIISQTFSWDCPLDVLKQSCHAAAFCGAINRSAIYSFSSLWCQNAVIFLLS
jgi:hypothetical protein